MRQDIVAFTFICEATIPSLSSTSDRGTSGFLVIRIHATPPVKVTWETGGGVRNDHATQSKSRDM